MTSRGFVARKCSPSQFENTVSPAHVWVLLRKCHNKKMIYNLFVQINNIFENFTTTFRSAPTGGLRTILPPCMEKRKRGRETVYK